MKESRLCLNMTSKNSEENSKTCIDLIKEGPESIKSSINKINKIPSFENLDKWVYEPNITS